MESLRHYYNRNFDTLIFRRTTKQIRNPGGLWDTAEKIFVPAGAKPVQTRNMFLFPSRMTVGFAHLELESDVMNYQGAEIPYIGFDELTHFTQKQFEYMLSRNRSTSGVPGYVRATCNPDPDSFVRKMIDWWIGKDGLPIYERCGIIRWFIRINDDWIWADTKEELEEKYGKSALPKSLTFIPSKLEDNQILMQQDPSYKANLQALSRVDRARLLDGNWDVRIQAGDMFKRSWFPVIPAEPASAIKSVRYWDRAATMPGESNPDPDWTRGLKMKKYSDGLNVVCDMQSDRNTPMEIEKLILTTASQDGVETTIVLEQEPGASGQAEVDYLIRRLSGYHVIARKVTKDKETRAKPVSSQAQAGNVKVVEAKWNDEFFKEVENFPLGGHDDQVDVLSGAFNEMNEDPSTFDNL